jgi:hypothetical protein
VPRAAIDNLNETSMTTDKKLYVALGVLALLAVALYVQNKKQKEEDASYSAETATAELPKLEFNDDAIKKIDRIVITQAAGDAGKPPEVALEKKGEEWQLAKPSSAKANDANVKSLVENLKSLKVVEAINPSKDSYAKYGLGDDKALHAVFYKGGDVAADLWFGDSGSRGQMTRIAGKDGVYAVKGYSSYLYSRDVKDWRDRTLFKFEDTKAKSVEIKNENGVFVFNKDGDKWTAKYKAAKAPAGKDIERFDPEKVKDLLRAYKALNADAFADGKSAADTGLDAPAATLTITLDDGAKKVLEIGKTAEGTNRWARANGVADIVSIGSWNADWATAKVDKFQKPDEKKGDKKDGGGDTPPPGMPGMPGMPPGMGEMPDPHGGH